MALPFFFLSSLGYHLKLFTPLKLAAVQIPGRHPPLGVKLLIKVKYVPDS
jgi:hypothetical protein